MQELSNLPALRLREMRQATVVPVHHPLQSGPGFGGVFDCKGRIEPASLLFRDHTRVLFPDKMPEGPFEIFEAPHIYAGFLINHYGHFLLESLARCWASSQFPDMPIVWASPGPPTKWQREIFDLLKLGDRLLFLERPTRFESLLVPDPGFRMSDYMHPEHAGFLATYSDERIELQGPRVWLSRGKLSGKARVSGEDQVEEELSRRGWEIVSPETLSIGQQLDRLASASAIAGIEGSALHTVVLLKKLRGPLIVVRRIREPSFRTISEATGIEQHDLLDSMIFNPAPGGFVWKFQSPRRTAELVDQIADDYQERLKAGNLLHPHDLLMLATFQDDNTCFAPDFRPLAPYGPPGVRKATRDFLMALGTWTKTKLTYFINRKLHNFWRSLF